jgi:hypothetical protein
MAIEVIVQLNNTATEIAEADRHQGKYATSMRS